MKAKTLTILICLIILNSCIVKSLHPFYTKNTISFEEKFIGKWTDNDNWEWEVTSIKQFFFENKTNGDSLSTKDIEKFNTYKDGYLIKRTLNNTESLFLAMPFKINNQLFIDFTTIDYDLPSKNLTSLHLFATHSFAKFDILNNDTISLKWFDEDKIKNLIATNKIKIKHEKDVNDNILLTASSEELQKFIKKYMDSKDEKKWNTSLEYNLQRVHAKP